MAKENNNYLVKELNKIFNIFFEILDYNELDLYDFLWIKRTIRIKYYIIQIIKYISLSFLSFGFFYYYYTLFSFNYNNNPDIIIAIVGPAMFNLEIFLIPILFLSISLTIFLITANCFFSTFKYSKSFFHMEKKNLNNLKKQLNLLLNNYSLTKILAKKKKNEYFDEKRKLINEKVDYFSEIFSNFITFLAKYKTSIVLCITILFNIISCMILPLIIKLERISLFMFVPPIAIAIISILLLRHIEFLVFHEDKEILEKKEIRMNSKLNDLKELLIKLRN